MELIERSNNMGIKVVENTGAAATQPLGLESAVSQPARGDRRGSRWQAVHGSGFSLPEPWRGLPTDRLGQAVHTSPSGAARGDDVLAARMPERDCNARRHTAGRAQWPSDTPRS